MEELLRTIYSLGRILVFFCIPAIASSTILQKRYKKTLDTFEILTIASAIGLFVLPIASLMTIKLISHASAELPFLFAFVAGAIIIIINWQPLSIPKENTAWIYIFLSGLGGILIWHMTHAYYPLPDLDPYYWLNTYSAFLHSYQTAATIIPDRPGFFGFLFLWNKIFAIDLYALLKYVIPLLFVSAMLPLSLVARHIRSNTAKIALIISLFWSSSTVLYAITPMPQAIFITALIYAVCFLLYARLTQKGIFNYLAGGILFITSLIHEISILPLILWFLLMLWHKRSMILRYMKKNPVLVILLGIILLDHISIVSEAVFFVLYWLKQLAKELSLTNGNLLFPADYVNVDGMQVGWAGLDGVIKYYLYYVGPSIIVLCAMIAYFCIAKKTRKVVWNEIKSHPETQIIASIAALFILISEVLPRATSIALLPDRAWIPTSIALIYPFYFVLKKRSFHTKPFIPWLFIALTGVSIAGAVFINYQKKFLIPSYQLDSATWIREQLPKNRIVISNGNKNLITFHAQSPIAIVSDLYCNNAYKDPENLLEKSSIRILDPDKHLIRTKLLSEIQHYLEQTSTIDPSEISSITSKYAFQLNVKNDRAVKNPLDNIYIYYYSDDPRNPYIDRPYVQPRKDCGPQAFDGNPETYKRIYEDGNRVIIWQVQ